MTIYAHSICCKDVQLDKISFVLYCFHFGPPEKSVKNRTPSLEWKFLEIWQFADFPEVEILQGLMR